MMRAEPRPGETVAGFSLVPPGTLYATFRSDDGSEFGDPVMAVFLRVKQTDSGPAFVMDGFLHDCYYAPVSECSNFVGFSPIPLPEDGGENG